MSPDQVQEWLEGVLPGMTHPQRVRGLAFLDLLAVHHYHDEALAAWGYTWRDLMPYLARPAYKAEYEAVRALVEIWRQAERMDAADRRAIKGWLEPHFGRGAGKDAGTVTVGHVRRYSDKLLELQLRAGDRSRYSERVEHAVTGAVLHFNIGAGLQTPDQTARVIEAESEDKAKT